MRSELSTIVNRILTIQGHVEQMTGLPSRWNGQVNFSEHVDVHNRPIFAARKEWDCSITVHLDALDKPRLFGSLVHECVHAVSVGLEPQSFLRFRGYEEGVVEKVTLLFGPQIAAKLNVPSVFSERASFIRYLALLEKLRLVTGKSNEEFILGLLSTPLAEREQAVVQWARDANPHEPPIRILAEIASTLRELRE